MMFTILAALRRLFLGALLGLITANVTNLVARHFGAETAGNVFLAMMMLGIIIVFWIRDIL